MEKSLRKLFTLGISHGQSFHDKRDIIFANQACFILLSCSLLVLLCNTLFGFYYRAIVPLFFIPFFTSIFFLQKKQLFKLAKILIITGAFLTGLIATLLFGLEAKTHYYLFASFALSMVLYSNRSQHILLFLIHFASFSYLQIHFKSNSPIIEGMDIASLAYFHIPLIFICVFVTLSEFVVHYQRYEKRISDLLYSVQEHSDLLQVEKTKFEVQAGILQRTNNLLVSEVEQREAIEKKLLSSNMELEQFAYVASHDLKEPLRTIGSFTQLLKRRSEMHFDKDAKMYYHYIVDGVRRMTNLLDDLLSFSKLNKSCEIESVQLEEVLDLNILSLNNALEKHEGKIIRAKQLPILNANKSQMSQLFQNLIANGLKFRREVSPRIIINYKDIDSHYLFSIRDNGIGIEKAYAEKIFVIFQRLDKKAKFEGTGIGLAICKKIVQNHEGKIWIESTPGEGTTFFFTISKTLERSEHNIAHSKQAVKEPML